MKNKTKEIVGLGKGIVVLEKKIGALAKRLELEMTERAECVKKLKECVEGKNTTIHTLETKIESCQKKLEQSEKENTKRMTVQDGLRTTVEKLEEELKVTFPGLPCRSSLIPHTSSFLFY